jgi:hypothetical protein
LGKSPAIRGKTARQGLRKRRGDHRTRIASTHCPYSCENTESLKCEEAKPMGKRKLRLVSPAKEIRTVVPIRRPNSELRPREHLTEREVEKLIEAARGNRHGPRDSTTGGGGLAHQKPARCGRLLAQTNTASAAYRPPPCWTGRGWGFRISRRRINCAGLVLRKRREVGKLGS